MQLWNASFSDTAINLAIDQWLLDWRDQSADAGEVLRLWENPRLAVVLGRGSQYLSEVLAGNCAANGVSIYRRSSGGASVVIGPGCLMYSLVLDWRLRPELKKIDAAHALVASRMAGAINREFGLDVKPAGICDLALNGKKVSGNAVRCQRHCMLYHGTLLYRFPLDVVESMLGTPPRQPDYRRDRAHRDFIDNMPVDGNRLQRAVATAWVDEPEGNVAPPPLDWPAIEEMVHQRYGNEAWTRRI